ncbi:MAG: hypothetical protein IT260_14580 [Saprospiraceae bacterium]|nr:hypothetical protein [Saprospiraceae bacterium]
MRLRFQMGLGYWAFGVGFRALRFLRFRFQKGFGYWALGVGFSGLNRFKGLHVLGFKKVGSKGVVDRQSGLAFSNGFQIKHWGISRSGMKFFWEKFILTAGRQIDAAKMPDVGSFAQTQKQALLPKQKNQHI